MATQKEHKGHTPAGGVRSVIYFKNEKGEAVDEEKATRVEVIEYGSDNKEIKRTHAKVRKSQ